MPTRIDKLTEAQRAKIDAWADRWIEIGLRTGKADRQTFEAAARRCYEHAKIPWPGRVVWVTSPLVVALAAPVAAFVLELRKKSIIDLGAVGGAVGGLIRKAVADVIGRGWVNYIGGQLWCGGWWYGGAYTSFFREICNLDLPGDLWQRGIAYEETIQSACWWYPHRDFVMVCERPTVIHRELADPNRQRGWNSHRLHCVNGPAVAWPDGWGVYAIHGARVPEYVINRPHEITVVKIKAEKNAEVRRIMIERFGEVRYIEESGMKPIAHDDKFGTIYLEEHEAGRPTARLRVTNRTAEPDGSFKIYWLPFNPTLYNGDAARIPQAAAASTWRTTPGGKELLFKDWRKYHPAVET